MIWESTVDAKIIALYHDKESFVTLDQRLFDVSLKHRLQMSTQT